MSQFNDTPERENNEVGNDSPYEVGRSVKNLKDAVNGNGEKGGQDGDGGSNNPENGNSVPDNSDGVPNNSDNTPNSLDNKDPQKDIKSPSTEGSNNINNDPNSPQQGGQNGSNAPPQNSGGPKEPGEASETPKVSEGKKPGDIAGESTGPNTGAGMGGHGTPQATKGGENTYQGLQAAENGAKAGAEAGGTAAAEAGTAAAEGAAAGSAVAPGPGTVAVAAANVAWSLRHTIAKFIMVMILVFAILASAVETVPGVIWQTVFAKDDKGANATIESVYEELEGVVQEVVTEAYNEAIEKAQNRVDSYGSRPDLNELYDVSLGPELTTDICDVIAHFTVLCKVENKEPTAKYLKKLLKANKKNFFPTEELKMQKIEYIDYVLAYEKNSQTKPIVAHISGENMDYYMRTHFGYGPSSDDVVSAGGHFLDFDGDYQEPIFAAEGTFRTWYNFYNWWYVDANDVFYKEGETNIVCTHDVEGNPTNISQVEVDNVLPVKEYLEIINTTNGNGETVREMVYITDEASVDGYFYLNKNQPTLTKTFENDGIDCIRVTVKQFNRNAMLDCFDIDNDAPFPLVADFDGTEVDTGDGGKETQWTLVENYTPEEYTCGMAITSYTEILKNWLFGSGAIIVSASGTNAYDYKVVSTLGIPVKNIEVSMYKDSACKQLVMKAVSDEDGIASFRNFGDEVYYLKETKKPLLSLYKLKEEVFVLDNSKKQYTTWGEYPQSSQGFISPLQVSGEGQTIKITSYFGYRISPTAGASSNHGGLDIVILDCSGNNIVQYPEPYPIRAVADGTVNYSGLGSGYGYYVHIIHDTGHQTIYAHNSQLCVKSGEKVKQGQIIAFGGGAPGTPGAGTSTGPHLHFEVRSPDGTRLNPLNYLPLNV